MKNICILVSFCFASISVCGQGGFLKAEYFFDADPGTGFGNPLTTPVGINDTISFISSIPTGSLLPGFHFLGLRMQHNTGNWGHFEKRGFYISSGTADAGNINAAEYFFDTDPGVGLGTVVTPAPNGAIVNFTIPIPTALPAGFHFLALRTRGNDGVWGLFEKRGFYISASSADASGISAAEYFFDTDPGVGLGTPVSPSPNGAVVNFTASIPASLSPGFHFLAIRVKGSDGVWGLYEKRGFYISGSSADATNISAAEYFFDNDPGKGLATPVAPVPNGAVVNFTASIPTSLPPGFHFVAIRIKGADGVWGLFETRGFYISTSTANMPIVTNAEYFFDTDPGVGAATPLNINTPGDNVNETFSIPVPGSMSQGQHYLAIRARDQDGEWGLFEYQEFTVSGTVPVTGLTFFAKKDMGSVKLDWYTLTENNSSHFEIERGTSGNDFAKISQKPSVGNSTMRTDYTFTDITPKKTNYYRLKQVDRDGGFKYSDTRVIKYDNEQYTVTPVKNNGRFTIEGINEKLSIRIFNNNGQLIKTIGANTSPAVVDITNAASGVYYLVLEKKGELLFTQKIIKE